MIEQVVPSLALASVGIFSLAEWAAGILRRGYRSEVTQNMGLPKPDNIKSLFALEGMEDALVSELSL